MNSTIKSNIFSQFSGCIIAGSQLAKVRGGDNTPPPPRPGESTPGPHFPRPK